MSKKQMHKVVPHHPTTHTAVRNKKIQRLLALAFLFACSFSNYIYGQQAVVTLDRSQILLGEQVTLQLKVENLTGDAQTISDWFNIPDSSGHIEVIHREKIDTISIEGQTTYIQRLTITSFDSGSWVIPVMSPKIKDVNGQAYSLKADSVTLEVMPVDVSKMKDFHPEKDIISVDYKDYTWLYVTGAILLLALLGFITYKLIKKYRNRTKTAPKIIKGPPMQWALDQIDLLVAENLLTQGKAKEFYTRLNDICRTYFDERLKSHTFQSTSKEMIEKLQRYLSRQKERADLEDFTRLGDFVKFAEHLPEEQKTAEAVEIARQTIRNVEKHVHEAAKPLAAAPVDTNKKETQQSSNPGKEENDN